MNNIGRPLKFKSPEELSKKIPNYFKNESHLCNFLEENIENFTKSWLKSGVTAYKREWELSKSNRRFGANRPRIDFMIETSDGKRVGIECKKVSQVFHESTRALSQLLSYSVIAKSNDCPIDELILLTTKYDKTTIDIIETFNLPIRYLIIGREYTAEVYGNSKR